jgi:hypothetical protein
MNGIIGVMMLEMKSSRCKGCIRVGMRENIGVRGWLSSPMCTSQAVLFGIM